jgi:hypothetical protein
VRGPGIPGCPNRPRDDIAYLRSQLDSPSRYAGLVHHDLNSTIALVTDRGVRLVDFEGCSFSHIGTDASFLHYPFPHYSAHWAVTGLCWRWCAWWGGE